MKQRKKLQELTIKDNFMFGAVMIEEENCKGLLELALEFPIEKVTVSKEKSIVYHPGYKGVRLDVIAKDEKRTHYNIEMQVAAKPAMGKRARYYHSQLDMEMLETGRHYKELPDAYVIFICDYDPFGKKRYRYTWDMICKEDPDAELDDGSRTIMLSTWGENDDEVPEELVKFLKFVGAGLAESQKDYDDDYVRRLQTSVAHVKTSREMEERYMLWEELIKEERDEAREEGRKAGLAEGIAASRDMILEVLTDLDGELSADMQKHIEEQTNPDILKEYFRKARRASSIEEFEKWINKI